MAHNEPSPGSKLFDIQSFNFMYKLLSDSLLKNKADDKCSLKFGTERANC